MAPGPDFTLRVPYQIHSSRPPAAGLAEIRGNEVVFLKPLSGQDEAVVFLEGFGDSPKDAEIVIENKRDRH